MDLDEWELLPDNGFLDFHQDDEKKVWVGNPNPYSKSVFNMYHFQCPPSPRNSRVPNQLIPMPIQLNPSIGKAPDEDPVVKEVIKIPIPQPSSIEKILIPKSESTEADLGTVSQVHFKKLKGNEFVDMKLDSPKSGSRGILPQIEANSFQFEDKSESMESIINSPRKKLETEMIVDCEIKEDKSVWEDSNHENLNLWKLSLTGIGAICSFGVAAATICIFIFGTHPKNKQQQHNQKFSFQITADEKRINQVVHRATRLNEAISAARGVSRAHITIGGYLDAL